MEPSSILAVLLPLATLTASPGTSSFSTAEAAKPVAFGRVIEVIKSRNRVERLHANRLRLSDDVSLGGVFNIFDANEDMSYTVNIRITF